MSSMNILLLMQLLPEPGRTDRKAADALNPCDRQALSCAARLKRQRPEVRLAAVLVTSSEEVLPPDRESGLSCRPADTAASVIRNALALGADDAVQIAVPAVNDSTMPDGAGLVQMAESFFSVSFSLIMTGFHTSPLLSEENVHRMGMAFCRNVTDLRYEAGQVSDLLQVQTKNPDGFSFCRKNLPLLAEFVRSPLPSEQPSFAGVTASYRYAVPVLMPDGTAPAGYEDPSQQETRPTEFSLRSFPLFFDTKKTAPPQIAEELLSVLSDYRLLPEAAPAGNRQDICRTGSAAGDNPGQNRCIRDAADSHQVNPLVWADRIVSVGRGAIGPGNTTQEVIRLAQCLARRLQAAVGASKAAVDLGLFPPDHQVGKTSSIVAPDLYVACGISGSVQHQDGMRNSRFIVAINSDPDASIFRTADVCICGDLREMLQALLDASWPE